MVRVDLDALVRGQALPGELCELDGRARSPCPLVRALAVDAFLALVFTEAGDIRAVAPPGPDHQRHACAPPSPSGTGAAWCRGAPCPTDWRSTTSTPCALGGATTLDNLALLCTHHHRLKTYEGWVLERHGPSDADPRWSFTPQPAFGQEPDLGLDRADGGPGPPLPRLGAHLRDDGGFPGEPAPPEGTRPPEGIRPPEGTRPAGTLFDDPTAVHRTG